MAKLPIGLPGGEPKIDGEKRERPAPDKLVRNNVIAALGRPPDLYEVTVRALWENHYRVNVLIGPDPTCVRIAHSYFVEAGENGDILTATPGISRLYS